MKHLKKKLLIEFYLKIMQCSRISLDIQSLSGKYYFC